MFSLREKTAVVTGGGSGIGKGICLAMAKAGANVLVAGLEAEPVEQVATQIIADGGNAVAIQTDITSIDGINKIVEGATSNFGYVHAWVNSAGSAKKGDVGRAIDLNEEQWDRVVNLNLKWTFFAMQAAAKIMTRGGSIINISSRSASQPSPMTSQYGAAKAGIENLTATLAIEWGHKNIRVNAIAPGVIIVENTTLTSERRRQRQIEITPLRRLGMPDDVGPLAVYLASDESSWVSGTVVQVTGGSRIPVGTLTYLHHINKEMDEKESKSEELD